MIEKFFDCLSGWINDWGPGLLIALIMLFGLYKLLLRLGEKVGLKILGALEKPAEALSKQASSMDRLTTSIQNYVGRDGNEHQEIIILQKVIRQELKGVREQSSRIENQLEEIKDGRSKIRDP